ncbi:NmrA family NAD(P)-binding protein [uncultured Nostoc sp.]|uniref:NmrA family NAD(P)-binding protein n=1 Tax=uncultured Nostoc sp. TaxID=340711 RepID=UPI0035CC2569
MADNVVLAGATGNLGGRIARALSNRKANVVALTRSGTSDETKRKALESLGVKVRTVDMASVSELASACEGAACIVSALQGLRDVIVDTQTVLLEAALKAGVARFIPSDFSTDFRSLAPGENRNYDLRREFHQRLDVEPIASTSIFNGVFGEVLTQNVPYLNFEKKMVGYWEDPDWRLDFTTMDDTAAYTAAAALDPTTPVALGIASFSVTPRELAKFTDEVLKTPFQLVRLGSIEELSRRNKSERAAHPEGENELYPQWQQTQYEHSMFSVHHESFDNDRYPDVNWTSLTNLFAQRSQASGA